MGVAIILSNAKFTKDIGTVDIPDCHHEYDKGVVTLAPTCVDDGVMTYTCTLCGHTHTEVIPATGEHTYVDGYCSVCGDMDIPDDYPVTDTLKGLYYLGVNETASIVDHSGNGNTCTRDGDGVTYADAYATFTGTAGLNRLRTPITTDPNNTTTIVALFRVPTGARPIVGNWSIEAVGFAFGPQELFTRKPENAGYLNIYYNARSTNFVACALTISNAGARVVKDADGFISVLGSSAEPIADWGNGLLSTLCIGGYHANISWNDTADIALVSIHEGEMTDAQLRRVFAYVRAYGESKGLTIE